MHLKLSNGSRQARQRCSDLHGVEPNWLVHSVSVDRQRGHAISRGFSSLADETASGGTMPYVASLRRPSLLIQSLLHAGASTCLTKKAPTWAWR